MNLPVGKYKTKSVKSHFRHFCPVRTIGSLIHLVPEELVESGKKLVLIDADNTLLLWRSDELPQETRNWVAHAQSIGLSLCLISNTRNRVRLNRLSSELKIEVAQGKFKPSREMYSWSLNHFKVSADEAIMIGDQIFTDVFGANRSGIEAILVHPMGTKEFVGTRFNRYFERRLHSKLISAMETAPDDLEFIAHKGIFQRKIVRQFAKFCIVGGTSFVIDYSIRMTLADKATIGGEKLAFVAGQNIRDLSPFFTKLFATNFDAFFPIAAFCGASIAIINSFFLNRLWTFEARNLSSKKKQFQRFLVISLIGLTLNTVISSIISASLHGDEKAGARIGTICAAIIGAFWNFFGQRMYAFKVSEIEPK